MRLLSCMVEVGIPGVSRETPWHGEFNQCASSGGHDGVWDIEIFTSVCHPGLWVVRSLGTLT